MKERLRLRKKQGLFSPGVMISLGLCFMLFLFAPMEIYLNNQSDFWYDYAFLLPYCLLYFGVAFGASLLLFGVLWLLGDRIYDLGLALYFIAFAGCYYQGNFQTQKLPLLDGADLELAEYSGEIRVSCLVWIVITLVVAVLCFRMKIEYFRGMVKGVGGFVFLILLVTIVTVFFTTAGYERTDYLTCTKDGLFEMSQDQNFVIFILDAVDAGTVEKVAEKHPEYREALRDFTYYSNTMSGYPSTNCAIPLALTGEWFLNQEPYQNYINRVFSQSSFFASMEKKGYEMSLYDTEMLLPDSMMRGRFKNMVHTDVQLKDKVLFTKRQLKMIGFKYAPWVLKPYCHFDAHRIWNQRETNIESDVFFWDNSIFYEDLHTKSVGYVVPKQCKIIHLEGAHIPFVYDAEMNILPKSDYDSSVEASMTVTMAYLDKLREAGVYDNSVIVIMADHGLGPDPDTMYGRQHPILFVKGVGEQHEMSVDDAPVCQADLVDAYEKLASGSLSSDVFEWKEGDIRERKFMYYRFYVTIDHMTEYVTRGHARDTEAMELTGIEYNE